MPDIIPNMPNNHGGAREGAGRKQKRIGTRKTIKLSYEAINTFRLLGGSITEGIEIAALMADEKIRQLSKEVLKEMIKEMLEEKKIVNAIALMLEPPHRCDFVLRIKWYNSSELSHQKI